jgi:molybdopterin molybdotransferase
MWFGMSADNKPVFALPGNPVSALVCLTRYVLPAIQQSLKANSNSNHEQVALAQPLSFDAELSWFVPVTLEYAADGRALATPRLTNTSGDFCALSGTAGFIELPCEANDFPAGYVARLFRW